MVRKGFRSWIASLLVVLLLVISVAPVTAAPAPLSTDQAIELLRQFNLVRGDGGADLRLGDTITRAEAATVFVRAMGSESYADIVKDSVPFGDTKGHWAAGYVTLAYRLNLMKGRDENTFDPQAPITNAEFLTVLLRMAGKEPVGPWSAVAIMQAASEYGLAPEGPAELLAAQPAYRGVIFRSLAVAMFTVPTTDGKTLAQKNIDGEAPVLELASVPGTTGDERITISGTVKDATPVTVTVKGQAATVLAGSFSANVPVEFGTNEISVVAKDAAGNTTVKTATIARGGDVASIEVTGPATVDAGKSVKLNIVVKDAAGRNLPASLLNVNTQNLGTFTAATGMFAAGAVGGPAKITFSSGSVSKDFDILVNGPAATAKSLRIRSINSGRPIALGAATRVEVEILGENGELLAYDQGRTITLSSTGVSGVTVTPSSATTNGGVATFTVQSTTGGTADLQASASGLPLGQAVAQFATARRLVLFLDQSRLFPDGSSQTVVTARLEDANGNIVMYNETEDIVLQISTSGPGSVVDNRLTLRRGYATTAFDQGIVKAGTSEGTLSVTGTVVTGPSYTVIPASIKVSEPKLSSGARFVVFAPSVYAVGGLAPVSVTVVDEDGDLITDGEYAFQVTVSTSNGETKTAGIPENVEVYLGDSGLNPVDDGYTEGSTNDGNDVVARTVNGTASLKVLYLRSGQVTISVVPKGTTAKAYDNYGNEDSAQSSTVINTSNIRSATTSFQSDVAALKLEVDSVLGTAQPAGAMGIGTSSTVKVRVRVVDSDGNWVPGVSNYQVSLNKVGTATSVLTASPATVRDGYAEFTVQAGSTVGVDTFTATGTRLSGTTGAASPNSTSYPAAAIEVENRAPTIPTESENGPVIASISGYADDALKEPNFVGTDDDGMAIVLNPLTDEKWAIVKVFREGQSTALYTSGAVNLTDTQVIKVPKDKLTKGTYRYQVSIRNSRGESSKSQVSAQVVNAGALTSVTIDSARFTAIFNNTAGSGNVLTVYASRLDCAGTIDTSKLTVVAGANELPLLGAVAYIGSDPTGNCATSTASQFQLLLTDYQVGLLFSKDFATTSTFIQAEAGWYESSAREQAPADRTGNRISPLAYIERAEIDITNKRLYVIGGGFSASNLTFDATKLSIVNGASSLALVISGTTKNIGTPSRQGDNKYVIPLLDSAVTAFTIGGFTGSDITVEGVPGWIKESTWLAPAQSASLYQQVVITQVQYDQANHKILIKGRGFWDGQANGSTITIVPANMRIKDWDAVPSVLDLTGATVSVTSDTLIELTLTTGPGSQEARFLDGTFEGYNIFFSADDGWYLSSRSIPAAGTPSATTYGVNAPVVTP